MPKHTPGPWVGFSDQGRTVAIMPAGREGDVCCFARPLPTEADASVMIAAPTMLRALQSIALCTDDPAIRNIAKEAIAKATALTGK